jgi:hypothetical protein
MGAMSITDNVSLIGLVTMNSPPPHNEYILIKNLFKKSLRQIMPFFCSKRPSDSPFTQRKNQRCRALHDLMYASCPTNCSTLPHLLSLLSCFSTLAPGCPFHHHTSPVYTSDFRCGKSLCHYPTHPRCFFTFN